MKTRRRLLARLGSGAFVLALASSTLVPAAMASSQAPVGLGTADGFAVLAGSTITNTGPTTARVLATYIVEKGKPIATPVAGK